MGRGPLKPFWKSGGTNCTLLKREALLLGEVLLKYSVSPAYFQVILRK